MVPHIKIFPYESCSENFSVKILFSDYSYSYSYRKALTEIDRLLKKQSNFTACKALKCLVLLKLERHEDARVLANELDALASSPTRTAPAGDASNMDENALTFFSQYKQS